MVSCGQSRSGEEERRSQKAGQEQVQAILRVSLLPFYRDRSAPGSRAPALPLPLLLPPLSYYPPGHVSCGTVCSKSAARCYRLGV